MQVDFYLLVLAAVYHADGLWGEATFDLYPRQLPEDAGYLVSAGMHEAVDAALGMRFSPEEIAWLQAQPAFQKASPGFWSALEYFEFTGDIDALPEGTPVFPGEPMLRVTAPLVQATLIQTLLLQLVSHGTQVATRASRLAHAAQGKRLYEFASRRMPGPEAALLAARAALVGGFYATSNALAASALGVPPMGTLSDGFFAAYGSSSRALEAFSVHFPSVGFVNLPDGSPFEAVKSLEPYRELIRMVRVDSSNLGSESRMVRQALNRIGMNEVRILGSGSLDEDAIRGLILQKAPIDLLGVGKALVRPMDGVGFSYRLAEIWRGPDPEPCTHMGGARVPGRKQVLRQAEGDLVCHVDEEHLFEGRPLLQPLVAQGERVRDLPPVQDSRQRCLDELEALPPEVRASPPDRPWPVRLSDRLSQLSLG